MSPVHAAPAAYLDSSGRDDVMNISKRSTAIFQRRASSTTTTISWVPPIATNLMNLRYGSCRASWMRWNRSVRR